MTTLTGFSLASVEVYNAPADYRDVVLLATYEDVARADIPRKNAMFIQVLVAYMER